MDGDLFGIDSELLRRDCEQLGIKLGSMHETVATDDGAMQINFRPGIPTQKAFLLGAFESFRREGRPVNLNLGSGDPVPIATEAVRPLSDGAVISPRVTQETRETLEFFRVRRSLSEEESLAIWKAGQRALKQFREEK